MNGKAANSILKKLKTNVGDKKPINPESLLRTPFEDIRNSGVSNSKARTILSLAEKTQDGTIPPIGKMRGMSDDEISSILTTVKGIGQ